MDSICTRLSKCLGPIIIVRPKAKICESYLIMDKAFFAPRKFNIIIFQFFGSLFLLFSLLMLIPTIISLIDWSFKDVLIGSTLTVPALLLGTVILYFTQKHICRVVVDDEYNNLIIKKRGHADETYDLKKINNFVLKELIFPMPGFKQYQIIAETDDERSITLFSGDIVFSGRRWNFFCEKLAFLTDKPLKRDSIVENLNGKFSSKKTG